MLKHDPKITPHESVQLRADPVAANLVWAGQAFHQARKIRQKPGRFWDGKNIGRFTAEFPMKHGGALFVSLFHPH